MKMMLHPFLLQYREFISFPIRISINVIINEHVKKMKYLDIYTELGAKAVNVDYQRVVHVLWCKNVNVDDLRFVYL